MKIAPKETLAFFPDHDPTDLKSSRAGYFRALVSVFDHILSAEECDACGVMFYREALENGKEKEYLAGERHFLAFYQELAKKGAYVKQKERVWFTQFDDPDFVSMLTESLRELHPSKLMDVYFPEFETRARGGFDRTDRLLFRNKNNLQILTKKARSHNLFILRSRYQKDDSAS